MYNIECKLDSVRERDMDLFLMTALSSDKGFADLFISRSKVIPDNSSIINIELSRTELELGESDVTVIVESDNKKYCILIEDKIDAIAMPDQHGRYIKRGNKGIKAGEYDAFDVFIFCPQKYYEANSEAKLYENVLTYEEALEYFSANSSAISKVWIQVLSQALNKAKKVTEVTLNEKANSFTIEYKQYIKKHYPEIDIRTSDNANGYWLHIGTMYDNLYIMHKIPQGYVDLTIPNKAEMLDKVYYIAEWLRNNTNLKITSEVTGKAAALRIYVPILNMQLPFSDVNEESVIECCNAISELSNIANFMDSVSKIGRSK